MTDMCSLAFTDAARRYICSRCCLLQLSVIFLLGVLEVNETINRQILLPVKLSCLDWKCFLTQKGSSATVGQNNEETNGTDTLESQLIDCLCFKSACVQALIDLYQLLYNPISIQVSCICRG